MAGETIIVRQGLRGVKGDPGDPGPAGRDGTGVVPSAGQVVAGTGSGSTLALAKGQIPRGDGTNVVAMADRVIDARDDGVKANVFDNVDQTPNILAALTRAGWNTGESGGTLKSPRTTVQLPSGTILVGTEIAANMTWNAALVGAPEMTGLQPIANLNSVIYWDGVGDGSLLANLYIYSPSAAWVAQDVIRIDRSSAVSASVHDVQLRNITIGDTKYVRGISLGRNSSNLDMAQTYLDRITVQGAWASGNVTTFQEGIHFGSSTSGNVLNMAGREISVSDCATGIYFDNTNVSLHDVFIGSGGTAFGGTGNAYIVVDGFRVESCDQFFVGLSGVDANTREIVFRNGWYSHNNTTTTQAIWTDRAGNFIFENVWWNAQLYGSTNPQMRFGGPYGRTVTFRNFHSQMTPVELWYDSGANWKYTRFLFDGYTQWNSGWLPIATYRGLYPRTVTASSNVMPYDGIMQVNATSGNVTLTFPPSTWHQGRELVITKTDASANTVAFTLDGTDVFSGASGASLTAQNSMIHAVGVPTGWLIVSRV